MIMRNKQLLFLAAMAVSLLLLLGCTRGLETAVPTIPLDSCRLVGDVAAQCGTLAVPENRAAPDGRMIDIHFAVIPAASSISEPDPVFMLAGGPGQAASEVFPLILPVFDDLNQNRDIVLVDQRGTGQSNPLDCPELEDLPLDATDEEALALLEACRQRLADKADLTQYITAIAMQDLDEVRAALGYDQINLFGTSYGTRAALSYMRLFPENVRTVVLNAVTSPELIIYLQVPADGQRALALLFERCASDDACQATFPDFEEQFWQIVAALGDKGQEVTFEHPITGEEETITLDRERFMLSVFNLLYSPDFLSLLPLLVEETAVTGDYGPLVAQGVAFSASVDLYQGMFRAVTCSEDAAFIEMDTAVARQADSQFPLTADEFVAGCQNWPLADVPDGLRQPLVSDIPTLLLSGEADPITPPKYAEQVAANLSNSRHIILPGYGHDVSLVGCIPTVITNFIADGILTNLDVGCVDEITPPPFFVSPTGPRP
jgi:pimeloyl-ACP methyl ester carboxylesterase